MTPITNAPPAEVAVRAPSPAGSGTERPTATRVQADGKHLSLDGRPFRVRGVTYGTFMPRLDGVIYPEASVIKSDLTAIAAAGLNTVRTYTLPPPELLDVAGELDLRVIVGLHYGDWRDETITSPRANRRVLEAGRRAVEEAMGLCSGRPEMLAISVGNEVPADIVRLHGPESVAAVLSLLIDDVHTADPHMLATYTNFPTTEFLRIEGQDLIAFNVFLEHPDKLRRYLRHLHVLAEDLPLVITELGLSEAIHGEEAQATSLDWQLRTVDECGCAGATIFSWTDEWAVAGRPVDGWGFGMTRADRSLKPALGSAARWARSTIRDLRKRWPAVSVVVCAHNESRYIGDCLESLARVDYPNLEVIVCDDGSTDGTVEIARRYPCKVVELPHGGLSAARNAGVDAATGRIVAFLDADATCHPEWPYHLVLSMEDPNVVACGGPNLPVENSGFVERVIARSPGGPVHVLLSDDRAEHVPGCNCAFLKAPLAAVGAFDPVYTAAGDDVDVCWKLLDRDHQIAFSPAAQVRHHRRDDLRAYLRQQKGYGRAERLLLERQRHRFNRLGQARWAGFIYGGPRLLASLLRPLIYHGHMGAAPFQHVVRRPSEVAMARSAALLPLSVPIALAGMALVYVSPRFLWLTALVLCLLAAYSVGVAIAIRPDRSEPRPVAFRALVAALHVAQPLVRAWGRIFRDRSSRRAAASNGTPQVSGWWVGDRLSWLSGLIRELAHRRCVVRPSDPHDGWDLGVWIGPLVACRLTVAVAWGWTPLWRVSFRLRGPFYVLVALGTGLLALGSPAGIPVVALTALAGLTEGVVLRSAVNASLRATTEGAAH